MQIDHPEPPRTAAESNGSPWAGCSSQISVLVGLASLLVSAVFSMGWIWDTSWSCRSQMSQNMLPHTCGSWAYRSCTNTCSQAQTISLFKIDCALWNCITVSGSKKCCKLPTAALIDRYCRLIPARIDTWKFREVLFLPLSIFTYWDQQFFPEGGRRDSCWCQSVKKYRKLCLFLEVILCLLAQWVHVQK